jgi:hypothetical protein
MTPRRIVSQRQLAYLHKTHPALAADMASRTPNLSKLPKRAPIQADKHRRQEGGSTDA